MRSNADNYSSFLDLPRRAEDSNLPDARSQVPTAAVVFGGLAVWAIFLLLML